MADNNNLLIIAEYSQNRIHPVILELLNKGRELADKADLKVNVLILAAENIENSELNELIYHGADQIQLLINSHLCSYLFIGLGETKILQKNERKDTKSLVITKIIINLQPNSNNMVKIKKVRQQSTLSGE